MTKLSSSLPKEYADDGLSSINSQLVAHPTDTHVVIALIDCKSITTEVDTGFDIATARILHIEPMKDPGAADEAREMLQLAQERRTGSKRLPIEKLNTETGELTASEILKRGAGLLVPGGTVTLINRNE